MWSHQIANSGLVMPLSKKVDSDSSWLVANVPVPWPARKKEVRLLNVSSDGLFQKGVHTFRPAWIDRVSAGRQWCDLRRGSSYVTTHMLTIKARLCFTGSAVFSVQAHLRASADPQAVHLTVEMFLLLHPPCVCLCVFLSAKQLPLILLRMRNGDMHRVNSIKVMTFFWECSYTE